MIQMKYHYQLVSETKVRIELIPEDQKEIKLFENASIDVHHPQLLNYFQIGLAAYQQEAVLQRINFMQFPKVALCSFEINKQVAPSLLY